MKALLGVLVVAGAGTAFLAGWSAMSSQAEVPKYVLADVGRGDITKAVTASGTLSAITTVLVSAQVTGQMHRIVADYNAEVRKGDLIAEIDPSGFEIRVEQALSELAVAEAAVVIQRNLYAKAAADLDSVRSEVDGAQFITERERIAVAEANRNLDRKRVLSVSGNLSQVEHTRAQAAFDTAVQALKGAEAAQRTRGALVEAAKAALLAVASQVAHADAVVAQRKSAVAAAKLELERTRIRAPTDGVVIGRTIEEGQMVGVSLQTQTLFTVAQDLKEMQIKISVDEADIGRIREGQPVVYTVDSYSGREFRGEVRQIRKDPQEKQNVVTYVVIASARNPHKILMPGMTANARIIIDQRSDVRKVPVAALRFAPAGAGAAKQSNIWTLGNDQRPKPIPVKVGLSDGKMVEVSTPVPVARVIIGVDQSAAVPTVVKRIIGSL